MSRLSLLSVLFCLLACSDDDIAPDRSVHLAGFVMAPSNHAVASYWKNGNYTALATGERHTRVTSLYVDGATTLIGGWGFSEGSPSRILMWRNGSESMVEGAFGGTSLVASNGEVTYHVWFRAQDQPGWVISRNGTLQPLSDTAYNIQPYSLTLSGEDTYLAGTSEDPAKPPHVPYSYQHAQCWRNGQLIFREPRVSWAGSVWLDGSDVYLGGYLYEFGKNNIACYWKNGRRVELTGEDDNALVRSVFVSAGTVYAAGYLNGQAVYWKDGTVHVLTREEGTNSMANAIRVHGGDIHVGGYQNGFPAYWKNDERQFIPNQDKPGQVEFLEVGSR